MKFKIYATLLLAAALVFNGCAKVNDSDHPKLSALSPAVQQLIDQHQVEIVDYDYAKKQLATVPGAELRLSSSMPDPTRNSASLHKKI